jgi:hypothetical protein
MKDTHKEYRVGQLTVGATAVKIPMAVLSDNNQRGVLIKAYGANDTALNTVPVFVGNAQVTVDDGFPLGPGESATLPVTGEDELYAVASAASQKIAWFIV